MMKRFLAFLLALALLLPAGALASGLTRTLQYGVSGEDVLDAQKRLAELEYFDGVQDGNFGKDMTTAVRQFQRVNQLTVDGKIGPKTYEAMNSTDAIGKNDPAAAGTLQYSSSGEAVKELQRQLRETYYYSGTIDGVFGSAVNRAVKAFQSSAGLTVDGKVGGATRNALYNRSAKIFNGGIPVRSLQSGDRGYDVFVLQQKLADLNYISYYQAGYFDSYTVDAIKAFQQANGLKVNGKADSTLRRYLWPTTISNQEEEENFYSGTPDDPYTERTLKQGMYGKDVANMQMRLKSAGYLLGNADGIFGPVTKAAVLALQKDNNLKQDGIVGPQTWAYIKTLAVSNAEPTVVDTSKPSVGAYTTKLRKGSSGTQVKKLQQQLIQLGYLPAGEDDGKYGSKTAYAVMQFQLDQHISVDGVAGPQTFVRLNEELGVQWDVPVG